MKVLRQYLKFMILFMVLGVLLGSFALVQAQDAEAGISQETADAFAAQFDSIFDGGNVAVADEIFSPEFVAHLPLAPQLDREGWKAYVASFYAAFPDLTQEVNQVIAAPDRVILHVTYTGTHEGALFGIPATGTAVSMDGIGIFSFDENGLATENWAVLDVVGLLAQIGAIPVGESDPNAVVPVPAAEVATGMMSEEEAAQWAERLTAVFDGPNFDIADELFAPDTVNHLPLAPNLDLEAWKAYVASFYVGIPDLRDQVNQIIIAPDRLILHSTYSGTHDGVLFGVPATGNPVSLDGITIFRFNEAGLVVEAWSIIDVVGLLAQIGAFPPAPAA